MDRGGGAIFYNLQDTNMDPEKIYIAEVDTGRKTHWVFLRATDRKDAFAKAQQWKIMQKYKGRTSVKLEK